MSIQAVGWVLDNSRSRLVGRLVLLALANHANDDHEAWPSQRTIAREAGISKSAVGPAVTDLVRLGEIEVVDAGDSRRSARYRLCYPTDSAPATRALSARPVDAAPAPGLDAAPAPWAGQNHKEPSGTISDDSAETEDWFVVAPSEKDKARTVEAARAVREALRNGRASELREADA